MTSDCIPGHIPVHASQVGFLTRRWYEGPTAHLMLPERKYLTTTPNHWILTHLGWKPAREVQVDWWVVNIEPQQDPRPARSLFDYEAERRQVHALPQAATEFSGDGRSGLVDVVMTGGTTGPPWLASDGVEPLVDLWVWKEAINHLIQPERIGMSNWAEVRRKVPEIDRQYPQGRPLAGDEALMETLGLAAHELPLRPIPWQRLSTALVGLPGRISLRKVVSNRPGYFSGEVYNLSPSTHAYLANNVVVGG